MTKEEKNNWWARKKMIFGELSLEEFKKQCPLNIIENPMYIKKSLEEVIKAKDENDFERLHTIVWLFKIYNINAYIALFCIVAICSD